MKVFGVTFWRGAKSRPTTIAGVMQRRRHEEVKLFLPLQKYDKNGNRRHISIAERLERYNKRIAQILK